MLMLSVAYFWKSGAIQFNRYERTQIQSTRAWRAKSLRCRSSQILNS